jgi:hypothetical protein
MQPEKGMLVVGNHQRERERERKRERERERERERDPHARQIVGESARRSIQQLQCSSSFECRW